MIISAAFDIIHYVCRVDGEVWVSPTRLALALSGGPSSEVQQEVAEGYVIVETNYRVRLQPLAQFASIPCLSTVHAALLNPKTSMLTQKRHFYTRNLSLRTVKTHFYVVEMF